jgi:hypothetical protein
MGRGELQSVATCSVGLAGMAEDCGGETQAMNSSGASNSGGRGAFAGGLELQGLKVPVFVNSCKNYQS